VFRRLGAFLALRGYVASSLRGRLRVHSTIANRNSTIGRRCAENLAAVVDNRSSNEPTILLAHYPSTVFRLPIGCVQLVLTGHTHGGQIRLPGLGCIWANDRVPLRISRGLHHVASTTIHVSPGIGVSLPLRIRWNCPPEVTVLGLMASHRTGNAPQTEVQERK
jgi:predicted MPP superfamily phosphohydrolase